MHTNWKIMTIMLVVALATIACGTTTAPTVAVPEPVKPELVIATSPDMLPLMQKLTQEFNTAHASQKDFATFSVVEASSSDMVQDVLAKNHQYQIINPDSSLWLAKINSGWETAYQGQPVENALPITAPRYSTPVRFAISPIVIAMWDETYQQFGGNGNIGWADVQKKATQDANFKWNHPSTAYASGLLATLAEFYGGAGVNRGLTTEMATADATIKYVKDLEATIRFYGDSEVSILQNLKTNGTDVLDAFVAQEQIVLRWNAENNGKSLKAVYPSDGTLWADHPLSLVEYYADYDGTKLTDGQRKSYMAFVNFLSAEASQRLVLAEGYRPTDLKIDLSKEAPFAGNSAVDYLQPKTTLPIPPSSVVRVVEDTWLLTKKPANVYLLIDTSGSMANSGKLPVVKAALKSFLNNIRGKEDKIGIIDFANGNKSDSRLVSADPEGKAKLLAVVNGMNANGGTNIIDAISSASKSLQAVTDPNVINAIVVMTDGQQTVPSEIDLDTLRGNLEKAALSNKTKLVIFSVAFGSDADPVIMESVAKATKGQFYRASEIKIEELYQIISKYL